MPRSRSITPLYDFLADAAGLDARRLQVDQLRSRSRHSGTNGLQGTQFGSLPSMTDWQVGTPPTSTTFGARCRRGVTK